ALASTLGVLGAIGLASYGIWFWNQKRALERAGLEHLAAVSKRSGSDLLSAREFMAKNDLNEAKTTLTTLLEALGRENKAGVQSDLDRAQRMLADVETAISAEKDRMRNEQVRAAVQAKYRDFVEHRRDAIYEDTQFTGL